MFSTLKKVWSLLKDFHKDYQVFALLIILYEGLQIAESYAVPGIILLQQNEVSIQVWIGYFALLFIYNEVFARFDNYIDLMIVKVFIDKTYHDLKIRALKKLTELDVAWHRDNHSGGLIEKIGKGVDKITDMVESISWELLPTVIQIVLSLVPLLIISPIAGVVLLLSLAVFLWDSHKAYIAVKPLRTARHDLYDVEAQKALETVQGFQTLYYAGAIDNSIGAYEHIHHEILTKAYAEADLMFIKFVRRRIRLMTTTRRLIQMVFALSLVQGSLGVADFIFVTTLVEKVIASIWRFSRIFDRVGEAGEAATRLSDLMNAQPSIESYGQIQQLPVNGNVEFNNISFNYEGTSKGVSEINLEAQNGQLIALVGESGAGKTTLMQLLTRQYDVAAGLITIGGVNVKDYSRHALSRLFAYVSQSPDIFDGTVLENLTLGQEVDKEAVIEACRKTAFWKTVKELPKGLETVVGERGVKLSGGQRQRLALTRALINSTAKVMILDEPTSAQDAQTESEIQEGVFRSFNGPVFVIAHRLSTIMHADVIIVMRGGRIVEQGTHSELLQMNGYYAELIQHQL